jgi:hypothetical protein
MTGIGVFAVSVVVSAGVAALIGYTIARFFASLREDISLS